MPVIWLSHGAGTLGEMAGKIEGIAPLGDGSLLLINDDDFGIAGARTQIVVVRGGGIARTAP